MITLAWAMTLPAIARASTTDSGSEPCPGISLQLHLGTTTPVLLVHGFNEGPGVFTSGSPSLESAITKAVGSAVTLVTFDYSNWSRLWNQDHLRRSLRQYETHHNRHRPYRSLNAAAPLKPLPEPVDLEQYRVRRHARAGGMINEYRLVT
jgi:hypothetical protein